MGAAMRAFDWTRSPLGPISSWPQSLRTTVSTCLNSRFPILIWWGPHLVKLYNDAYKDILGAKHPAALGHPGRETWPEIWDVIGPMLEGVLSRGEATWSENLPLTLVRRGFAEECYFTFSYSPIRDEGGGIGGVFSAVSETTGQVLGERRLRALRDLSERTGRSSTREALRAAVADVLAANSADVPFSLLCLFRDEQGHDETVTTTGLLPLDASALVPSLVQELPEVMPVSALEERLGVRLALTGELRPIEVMVLPVRHGGEAAPAGVLVVGTSPRLVLDDRYRDFLGLVAKQIGAGLETINALEQTQKRAEALAEIDRAKTAFFSNVSHEFRTPLTLMLGPTEDALVSGDGAMRRESVEAVHRNGLRLLKLVNSLLDFARIEAGRVQASYEPTDLPTLTADLASAFRSAVERAGLAFRVECPPLAAPAFVDRDMWEKIVLNLLSNALKFTFDGAIDVILREEGSDIVLRVCDSGCGIPAHELPHVFERFHRVHGARSRTHEGSGIGLAMVHELTRLHGGTVSVESQVGGGTIFTVRIPQGSAHLPADRVGAARTAISTATSALAWVDEAMRWLPPERGGEGSGLGGGQSIGAVGSFAAPGRDLAPDARILVADDNADMRDYLRRLLAPRWSVETVADGSAALAAAREGSYDIILSDVMMPGLDGFALLSELRADARTRDVPFIMLSARAGEEARLEGLRAGVDDYLVKPFSARELIARIESQLARLQIRAVEERHARRLAAIFEHAPVGISLLRGPEHVYDFANAEYLKLVANRAIVGKPIRAALPELEGQGIYELLDRVRKSGEPFIGRSVRLVLNRGPSQTPEECFFDFVYEPLREDDGSVDSIIVVVFDVTELARARHSAEAANRTKDEFLAILGHELRNPLAPILTALQLLRLRGDGAERERTIIERQVQHLIRLVDDLLDVSRVTRGKIELKRQRVDLAEVMAKAIEMASPLLEQREHQLRVDVPRHGLVVDGDATRLGQVFANILTNAAKYTEPRGAITVTGARDGDDAVIRVRDTGVGIAAETLPHVFDLFVQEGQALDRSQGGLGLGLAIVRSLVSLHGGRVTAHSDGHGLGSEFTVRLPLVPGEHAVVGPESPSPPVVRRGGASVLVVDDNRDAAELLAEALRVLGFATEIAHDGPTALAAAAELKPQLVLLDIGLPVMDGYEVARRLRANPSLTATHLIAITGYGQESDHARSREAGFDEHLVKPIDLDRLSAIVDGLTAAPDLRRN